ncbi:dephospho-CoA kinase [Pedobacter sp. UYP30]|uniref:dephospho-CoA kinase n=1 Tax=Pedobacter sp. UYP30 TaxID=1756400 RepID=UPI00339753AF
MYKVGITGGIGSGKTLVCRVFEQLGIPVFFADEAAKGLMVSDEILVNEVKKAFGNESYFSDGKLNNKWIANIVFNNKTELEKLNALVHPAVFRAFDSWSRNVDKKVPYVLKEAALLFESAADKMCNATVVVVAPLNIRLERVMERDQVSEKQVMARVEKQFTDEHKIRLADFQLINDSEHSLIEQVLALNNRFLKEVVPSN